MLHAVLSWLKFFYVYMFKITTDRVSALVSLMLNFLKIVFLRIFVTVVCIVKWLIMKSLHYIVLN